MKLNTFAYLYSKPLGNHTLKIMKKIPGYLLKNLEKSWKYHGILSVRKSGNPAVYTQIESPFVKSNYSRSCPYQRELYASPKPLIKEISSVFNLTGSLTAQNRWLIHFYRPWGKVIFSEACVKNSVHRGICLGACWDTTPLGTSPPPSRTPPPGPGTPWSRHPPPQEQGMLGDTVNEWAVCILLECNLVSKAVLCQLCSCNGNGLLSFIM